MDNYKIGDEVELLEDFYTRSGAEIIFKKGTIAKVIELQLHDEIHIDVNGDNRWCSPDILKLVDKKDPALISGADALADITNVQHNYEDRDDWYTTQYSTLTIPEILKGETSDGRKINFRLKPQTIKLELELPKPFDPKEGDLYWFITCRTEKGYSCRNHKARHGDYGMQYGAYRSEDDAKKAVEQLRKIRGAS
ncbi:hypothetical protein F886_00086 [Acinetobacter sp. NIPH 542]|uniref:SPOR domain-containing protein n=1 Tax=Acinetobacter sp. NIPH 542 TaxID=1217688 RepID=UPI0002CEE194|nr:SPOR domain-containing protein [Acinetobacter sp. NIPH 542]ENX48285.1 hypothetical protein F886_00086 [Acinetobacter sp. NIPH 542]